MVSNRHKASAWSGVTLSKPIPQFSTNFRCPKRATAWLIWGGWDAHAQLRERYLAGCSCALFLPFNEAGELRDWSILRGRVVIVIATFAVQQIAVRKLLRSLALHAVRDIAVLTASGQLIAIFEASEMKEESCSR